MTETSTESIGDVLSVLLSEQGLSCASLIDDAYDPLDQMELQLVERNELWTLLEEDDDAIDELSSIGHTLSELGQLTSMTLAAFDENRAKCPAFENLWRRSLVGQRIEGGRSQIEHIRELLEYELGLSVGTFGGTSPTEDLVSEEAQILFIDWYLGGDLDSNMEAESEIPKAVEHAVTKVMDILRKWPNRPKPIFVLMSSHSAFRNHASEFCRRSGILRGMFYAIPKDELTDKFKLRIHMRLFAMSITAGRELQSFVDALNTQFDNVKKRFLEGISDLTLNDYAYVQSFSLQDDGQPLGDYLLWLFSTYLGQLLFAEALHNERAKLDSIAFTEVLPNLEPPSERLTEIYHTALFDTSVGPITSLLSARRRETTDDPQSNLSALTLGDVLNYQKSKEDSDSAASELATNQSEIEKEDTAKSKPDLLLVINPQCDLMFTPDHDTRPVDLNRSILLLPGYLKSIFEPVSDGPKTKTELYRYDGGSYRIEWDIKKVVTIPFGEFDNWKKREGYERNARLRLPLALEMQHALATNLTRIGTPTMPPIYQPIAAHLLRVHKKVFGNLENLQNNEAVFLVLTKKGQQCALTYPLAMRLRTVLDERLAEMRSELANESNSSNYLDKQKSALERMLNNDSAWVELLLPFDIPTIGSSRKLLNGYIQVVCGIREGDETRDSKIIAVVNLDLNKIFPQ